MASQDVVDEPKGNHVAESNVEKPAEEEVEEKKVNENNDEEASKPVDKTDFSGSWVLKSSSKSIDAYYKSEGWGYAMRKAAPWIAMRQIITQNGDKFKVRVIVGPGGKFADATNDTVLGGSDEYEFKDKDGLQKGLSKWNGDFTKIISETYRVNDEKRRYTSVRYLSVMSDDKMMIDTTNCHEITLTQTFEREAS